MSETVVEAPALPSEAVVEAPTSEPSDATLSLAGELEALLYAAGEPASLSALATALDATASEVEAVLEELTAQYAVRGIRMQRSGNKVQLVTAPELAAKIQKFLGLEEINRLSSAALETLAIIAYSQPITKPQLEMVRGVNCDGVMNTLIARNLIQELGRTENLGHAMRYGVSFEFLQYFGLRGVHELPPVDKLETLPVETGKIATENTEILEEIIQPDVALDSRRE